MKTETLTRISSKGLNECLNKIGRVFDAEELLGEKIDNDYVVKYYAKNSWAYRRFHSTEDSVHMALNFDGNFDKDGYYEQARIINKVIQETGARNILELASGKGFNSIYYRHENPMRKLRDVAVPLSSFWYNKKHGTIKTVTCRISC